MPNTIIAEVARLAVGSPTWVGSSGAPTPPGIANQFATLAHAAGKVDALAAVAVVAAVERFYGMVADAKPAMCGDCRDDEGAAQA